MNPRGFLHAGFRFDICLPNILCISLKSFRPSVKNGSLPGNTGNKRGSIVSEEARYWNPLLETLPQERIRALQLKKFKRIFEWAYDHSRFHKWQSFEEVFGESLAMIHEYNKPIWIAEIGCVTDPRRKEWLEEFFAFMDQSCCINVFLWFNDHKKGEPDLSQ